MANYPLTFDEESKFTRINNSHMTCTYLLRFKPLHPFFQKHTSSQRPQIASKQFIPFLSTYEYFSS